LREREVVAGADGLELGDRFFERFRRVLRDHGVGAQRGAEGQRRADRPGQRELLTRQPRRLVVVAHGQVRGDRGGAPSRDRGVVDAEGSPPAGGRSRVV
jgi:hypothetical protein